MEDWAKWVVGILSGVGAWSLTLYFGKGWFEERVLKRLDAIEKALSSTSSKLEELSGKINGTLFTVNKANAELRNDWTKEAHKLGNLFMEATKYSTTARHESKIALDKTQELTELADKKIEQAKQVGQHIMGRIKVVEEKEAKNESEIVKLKDDLVLIKGKK